MGGAAYDLMQPNPSFQELQDEASGALAGTYFSVPLFVLMGRGPRPEALRTTALLPNDVRLLWAGAELPAARSPLLNGPEFHRGEVAAEFASHRRSDSWAYQRLLDASMRLHGYTPLAPALCAKLACVDVGPAARPRTKQSPCSNTRVASKRKRQVRRR